MAANKRLNKEEQELLNFLKLVPNRYSSMQEVVTGLKKYHGKTDEQYLRRVLQQSIVETVYMSLRLGNKVSKTVLTMQNVHGLTTVLLQEIKK